MYQYGPDENLTIQKLIPNRNEIAIGHLDDFELVNDCVNSSINLSRHIFSRLHDVTDPDYIGAILPIAYSGLFTAYLHSVFLQYYGLCFQFGHFNRRAIEATNLICVMSSDPSMGIVWKYSSYKMPKTIKKDIKKNNNFKSKMQNEYSRAGLVLSKSADYESELGDLLKNDKLRKAWRQKFHATRNDFSTLDEHYSAFSSFSVHMNYLSLFESCTGLKLDEVKHFTPPKECIIFPIPYEEKITYYIGSTIDSWFRSNRIIYNVCREMKGFDLPRTLLTDTEKSLDELGAWGKQKYDYSDLWAGLKIESESVQHLDR